VPLDIVSVESLALGNVYEVWREAPMQYTEKERELPSAQPADVVIHMGHTHSVILVLQDGYLLDVRSVDWGGKELAELIASKYSLHYVEALKELRKKAFVLTNNEGATREQVALSEIIKTGIDRLAHEVQLILLELKATYNLEYRMALTSGGPSLVRNLGPYLTQKLEIPVNRLSALENLPNMNFASSPNNEIAFLTAIGIAAEGLRRPKNPALNLLKGEFAKQSEAFRLMWEKWRPAVWSAVAIFVICMIWSMMRDGYASDMANEANTKLRSLAGDIISKKSTNERAIQKYIDAQEQKVRLKQVFEDLQDISTPLDILKRVTQAAPAKNLGGINVTAFTVNNENIYIAGEARNNELVTRILSSLKSVATGGQVTADKQMPAARAGYTPFAYNFKMQRRAGGKNGS
jgi:general secretion pathway protein L